MGATHTKVYSVLQAGKQSGKSHIIKSSSTGKHKSYTILGNENSTYKQKQNATDYTGGN